MATSTHLLNQDESVTLTAKNVNYHVKDINILGNINVQFKPNEMVALMGTLFDLFCFVLFQCVTEMLLTLDTTANIQQVLLVLERRPFFQWYDMFMELMNSNGELMLFLSFYSLLPELLERSKEVSWRITYR